ncbi:tape measure protein, partial [Klebsiella pneumoniae]
MSKYGIDIEVNPRGAVSGSRVAERSLLQVEQASKSLDLSLLGLNARFGGLAGVALVAVGALTAATRALASQADQVDRLNVRLSRHTSSMGETISVYSELRDVSTATRTSLEDNIALFDRFAAIGPELGKSNEEITAFVEQLVKLGALSGSSAEEQANALRQLAQGLAAGTLRAEEFNSIVEQAPEILRVVARESGRTFGQLRQDMLDGKITAELLFESIAKGADTTDAQFSKFKATTDELFTTAAALARDAAAALGEVSGAQAAWNATAQFTVELMAALARELDSMRDTPKTIDGLALRMGDLRKEITELTDEA